MGMQTVPDRRTILDAAIEETALRYIAGPNQGDLLNLGLLVALPTPTSAADEAEQVAALRVSVRGYARAHQDWAMPVITKMQAAWGVKGERFATTLLEPTSMGAAMLVLDVAEVVK